MKETLISTVEHCGEVIDCRCLTLAFEYYDFSDKEVMMLLHDIIQWLEQLSMDVMISDRTINGKHSSKEKAYSTAKSSFAEYQWLSYAQDLFVTSSIIHNQKTLNSHIRKIRTGASVALPSMSVDYPDYWEHLFSSGTESSDVIKDKLLSIFREKHKHAINYYPLPDVQMLYTAIPYAKHNERFYGRFFLNYSAFSLNFKLQHMSEAFSAFAIGISSRYVKLNARVQLQPVGTSIQSPHMRYFGAKGCVDESHVDAMCTKKEWYQTYYIPSGEWFNIVSPLAQVHLSDVCLAENGKYTIKKMSNGG